MLTEAMKHIVELAAPKIVEIDGAQFLDKTVQAPPEYHAATLEVTSLQGVVDYLVENRDALERAKLLIHVQGPTDVSLYGAIAGRRRKREHFLHAKPLLPDVQLGRWISREAMSIQLQSMFTPAADLEALLRQVGNMEAQEVRTYVDDGVSQQVTVRKHAGTVERELVKRVVHLRPYRTFHEVEQPESPFVFRVRESEREGLQLALFEADGGMWRRAAVEDIGEWLAAELKTLAQDQQPAILR